MKKRKVLLVITKGNWGGAQKYVFELATNLPPDQFDPRVLYGEGDLLPKKLSDKNIPSERIPELARDINLWQDFSSFIKLVGIFRRERPDVVHLNSSKIGGLGALAGRLAGVKKIIFTVHGFAFSEDRPVIQKKIIAFLSWLTLFLATDVITISKKEFDQAKKWPFVSRKINLIYNGVRKPDFLDRDTARQKIAALLKASDVFSDNKFVVGSIGELTKNKGHCYGLKTFKDTPGAQWIIIGEGEERAALEKIIAEKNLGHQVYLPGYIQDASTLLKAFDALLLPSVKEGLPYVLIEAGLAHLPVIATNVGGIPEIISNGHSGILVGPKDPFAIEKALQKLMDDGSAQQSYATALESKVSTTFNLSTMADSVIQLYSRA